MHKVVCDDHIGICCRCLIMTTVRDKTYDKRGQAIRKFILFDKERFEVCLC